MKLLSRFKSLTSSPRRKQFLSLIVFSTSYMWFKNFSNSVLNPHFLNQGLSLQQMILGTTLFFSSPLILQLVKRKYSSRKSWRLAPIISLLFILMIIRIFSVWQFYLASIIGGLAIIFFWLPYNINHFELTPKHRTGLSSAILFSLISLVTLTAPLVAGFLAQINYLFIWVLSGVFFLIPFSLVKSQRSFTVSYSLKSSIREIKATRLFIFLQGIWEAMIFGVIPIFSLYFIKSPLYYGTYMAYLSLMGILANLLLGRYTDKKQKRIIFLYPLTLIMAITTFLFPLAISRIIWWIAITGIIQFFAPLFWNISTAMIVDAHLNLRQAIPAREFVLSSGRILGLALIFINFKFQSKPTYIFYFLGTAMLLYPIILFYNTKISKKYTYL